MWAPGVRGKWKQGKQMSWLDEGEGRRKKKARIKMFGSLKGHRVYVGKAGHDSPDSWPLQPSGVKTEGFPAGSWELFAFPGAKRPG